MKKIMQFNHIISCLFFTSLLAFTTGCENDEKTEYTLTVNILPAGGGTVDLSPSNVTYPEGIEVTLSPNPSSGYEFTSWSGTDASYVNNNKIVMSKNMTVIANFSINSSSSLNSYFPIEEGVKWTYRVDFPKNCSLPYMPWFIYPEGLISTSMTHGMGSWNEGQINFEILVNEVFEIKSDSTTWNISLSSPGNSFYFYISSFNSNRLQLIISNEKADLNIIGEMDMDPPRWQIARALARLTSEDLSEKFNISVPAGDYSNCVKSIVNINGDGTHVYSGTYPIEIYLAPNVGIAKAIGKDRDGTVLYTLELTEFSN